jgi:hypothetical protein
MRGLPETFPVNPRILAEITSSCQDSDGVILTDVRVDGRCIVVQSPNQPEYELFAHS